MPTPTGIPQECFSEGRYMSKWLWGNELWAMGVGRRAMG